MDVEILPASSSVATELAPGSTASVITIGDSNEILRSTEKPLSNANDTHRSSTNNTEITITYNTNSLAQENKILREKVAELEEQLMYQRETSIRK